MKVEETQHSENTQNSETGNSAWSRFTWRQSDITGHGMLHSQYTAVWTLLGGVDPSVFDRMVTSCTAYSTR